MQVTLIPASLTALDELACDLLVLSCFVEDCPLHSTASLVDWRLNGWLSRLLLTHRFRSSYGEQLLFPAGHRIGPRRGMLLGLGSQVDWEEGRLAETADRIWGVVMRLHLCEVAVALPLSSWANITKRRVISLLTGGAHRHFDKNHVDNLLKLNLLASPEDLKGWQSSIGS